MPNNFARHGNIQIRMKCSSVSHVSKTSQVLRMDAHTQKSQPFRNGDRREETDYMVKQKNRRGPTITAVILIRHLAEILHSQHIETTGTFKLSCCDVLLRRSACEGLCRCMYACDGVATLDESARNPLYFMLDDNHFLMS